jgi:site-specific DNA-methyltransferase (adenine-specific)
MELNKVYNIDFLNNDLPNKCAKLIIADPPYYKTKGDFDFIWKTFEDYLLDVEKWCLECKRILADNGTLFWYGGSKNIAYAQIIFDKHFNLINNLTWNKGSFMGLEESEGLRSFAPCTERILMYEHKKQFEFICDDIRNYLIVEKAKSKLTLTDLNEILIGKRKSDLIAKRYFGTSQWELPTKEKYLKLQKTGFFKREFEDLRREFEDLRRPFNNIFNLQEVLNYSNEAVKVGNKYDHDTVKPETLTRALILTCSRENDLVVVPFTGSGTECAMSAKEKRPFIGYEITKKHADMSQERANKILSEPKMF